jgi:alanyl-tRNA synthetase
MNQTPFYGESGGQMGDAGVMFGAKGIEIAVADTQKKLGDLHVHQARVTRGTVKVGDALELRVDGERRSALRANHSATHLLHQALRRRLGAHVTQKGSLVAPDRLRFDFSQPTPLTPEDVRAIEVDVNAHILGNSEVTTRLMTPDAAQEAGALALFGEKYGEEVRVVSMGLDGDVNYSTELCGGTHARRTGDIGLFKIVSEGAVAAGVRRIEAVTRKGAIAYIAERERVLLDAAAALRVAAADLPARVAALVEERRKLERELAEARRAAATGGGGGKQSSDSDLENVKGVPFLFRKVDGIPAKDLKSVAEDLEKRHGSGVFVVVSEFENKANVVVSVSDDLTSRFDARELVKKGSSVVGGKGGGGRVDMAQGGGPDVSKIPEIKIEVRTSISDAA